MKTILVPLEGHDEIGASLEAAVLLATTFRSHVEGLMITPSLSLLMAADAIGASVVSEVDLRPDPEQVRELQRRFSEYMESHGIPRLPAAADGPSHAWREGTSAESSVGSRGRVFDLTVLGRPVQGGAGPRMITLEAALFESGHPVLIVPPVVPPTLGQTVLIAWNGSTETARTVSFAKPLLRRARAVSIVTVEGTGVPGPTGEDVVSYLARNGIASRALTVKRGTRSVGEALLATAADLGCDLLVKGAFTQSRLRQMIFGGATRHLIAEADLPVFMAH